MENTQEDEVIVVSERIDYLTVALDSELIEEGAVVRAELQGDVSNICLQLTLDSDGDSVEVNVFTQPDRESFNQAVDLLVSRLQRLKF